MAEKQKGRKIGNKRTRCGNYRSENNVGRTAKARRVLRTYNKLALRRLKAGRKPLKPEQAIPGWYITQDGMSARPNNTTRRKRTARVTSRR